ncbi:hypothetical protein [Haloimpatiens lingqiaonensis]|uniref:hypothetical protein n=1 Tax=Haloimpatiens lingqiaonensis TaxID=1380675 RepID=UPI0010FDF5E6|nr:hypothetical protein [Haloimpatiens lingqiaonensis]
MAKKRSGIAKALGGLAILSAGIYAVVKLVNRNKNIQSECCEGCTECEDALNITENEDIDETTEKTEEEKIDE